LRSGRKGRAVPSLILSTGLSMVHAQQPALHSSNEAASVSGMQPPRGLLNDPVV
jgi:hypothetical protein